MFAFSGRFVPWRRACGCHWQEALLDQRCVLDVTVEKKHSCMCWQSNRCYSVCSQSPYCQSYHINRPAIKINAQLVYNLMKNLLKKFFCFLKQSIYSYLHIPPPYFLPSLSYFGLFPVLLRPNRQLSYIFIIQMTQFRTQKSHGKLLGSCLGNYKTQTNKQTNTMLITGLLISPQPDLLPDVFCLVVRIFLLMLVLLYIYIYIYTYIYIYIYIYIYNKTSIKRNILTTKQNTSGSRSG